MLIMPLWQVGCLTFFWEKKSWSIGSQHASGRQILRQVSVSSPVRKAEEHFIAFWQQQYKDCMLATFW